MGLAKSGDVASRFSAYVEGLTSVIGHADRAKPLRDYCTGLMMPCDRKSVEPMAAITAPDRTAAQHQSLLHFVGQGDWSDQQVLAKVRRSKLGSSMIRAFPRRDGIRSGCAAILRPVGQARQLSGRRDPFACKSSCELAGGLSSVSAKGVGDRPYTSAQSRCTQGNYLQDQAGQEACDRPAIVCLAQDHVA